MGIFKIKTRPEKWAAIVAPKEKQSELLDEKQLHDATDEYIKQHAAILHAAVRLVVTSNYKEIIDAKYKEACGLYGDLIRIRKYSDAKQKEIVNRAIDEFIDMDKKYHNHSLGQKTENGKETKKQKKGAFWQVYGESEALDIFSGKKK